MTDKEKITKGYLELLEKFFEDSDNIIFVKDIGKSYLFFMKGNGEKVLNMTLELCKSVIEKTEIPIDLFIELLKTKLEQKSEGFSISEILRAKEEGEDAKEKSDPLH